MTEDQMVGWHHRHDGHAFKQTPGDSEGLVCCHSRGHRESDMTEQLNKGKLEKSDEAVCQMPGTLPVFWENPIKWHVSPLLPPPTGREEDMKPWTEHKGLFPG